MGNNNTNSNPKNRPFVGPLFVIGMPRSGTKLLRELLNRHPAVHIPEIETEFLPYLAANWGRFGDVSGRRRFHRMFRHMQHFPYFRYRRAKGRPIVEEDWYRACRSYNLSGVFEALIRIDAEASAPNAEIWGDKSPSYVRHLKLLMNQYPDGKVIHIVRDVRDYCRSIQRAWGKNPVRAAFRWNEALLEVSEATAGLTGRYLEVRYEQLLDDAESEVKRLCQFVGIDFHREMLDVGAGTENLGDAKGAVGIASENKGKYKSEFDHSVLLSIEEAAFPAMRLYDYRPMLATAYRPPGALRLQAYQLLDGFNLIKSDHPGKGRLGGALFHLAYKRITRVRS